MQQEFMKDVVRDKVEPRGGIVAPSIEGEGEGCDLVCAPNRDLTLLARCRAKKNVDLTVFEDEGDDDSAGNASATAAAGKGAELATSCTRSIFCLVCREESQTCEEAARGQAR